MILTVQEALGVSKVFVYKVLETRVNDYAEKIPQLWNLQNNIQH